MLMSMYDKTGEMPQALKDRPELGVIAQFYLECFYQVSSDRPFYDGSPGALSTGILETYRRVFEIPDKEDFHLYLRAIDSYWLNLVRKKQAADNKKT